MRTRRLCPIPNPHHRLLRIPDTVKIPLRYRRIIRALRLRDREGMDRVRRRLLSRHRMDRDRRRRRFMDNNPPLRGKGREFKSNYVEGNGFGDVFFVFLCDLRIYVVVVFK